MKEKIQLANCQICNAWGRTSIGGRDENQDSFGGVVLGDKVVLTVCDGMGGMAGGQRASSTAVNAILETMTKLDPTTSCEEAVLQAVTNANAAIYDIAMKEPELRGMGTTATLVVLTQEAAFLAHVGDSRIYRLKGKKKLYRTRDHSRVMEMVIQGHMTEEEARQSNYSNIITRALGIRPNVEVDIAKVPYRKGDRFLLCSDGIWNTHPEPKMLDLFSTEKYAEENVVTLTDSVDKYGQEEGNHHDNLTVIMADILTDSNYQYSAWQQVKQIFKKKNK